MSQSRRSRLKWVWEKIILLIWRWERDTLGREKLSTVAVRASDLQLINGREFDSRPPNSRSFDFTRVWIYNNNRIVSMCGHACGLRGQTDGRTDRRGSFGRHGRQAASADRLRVRIDGSGGGGQAKIAMSRQRRGLRGRTDSRAGTGNPVA